MSTTFPPHSERIVSASFCKFLGNLISNHPHELQNQVLLCKDFLVTQYSVLLRQLHLCLATIIFSD